MCASRTGKITVFFLVLSLTLVSFATTVSASTSPEPSYAAATVDGDYSEWDLTNDFFADMYRAGDPAKKVESKLYLRYDQTEDTMYVLVLTVPGVVALQEPDNAWIAINGTSNKVLKGDSGNDGVPPDFEWVYNTTSGDLIGYEGSFPITEGIYEILAHVQVEDDGAQTSATDRKTDLDGIPVGVFGMQVFPGLEIEKGVEDEYYLKGGTISYVYTVSNTGNAPLNNVTVSDAFSGSYSGTAISVTGPASGDDGNNILDPGETWEFLGMATAPGFKNEALNNIVTVKGEYEGQEYTASDDYTLYPLRLRKNVVLYWDSKTYPYSDETPFEVNITDEGGNEIGTVEIKEPTGTATQLWMTEGAFTFEEVNVPEGYESVYGAKTWTFDETYNIYTDWSFINVITFDLALSKSGPEYVEKGDSATYDYTVTNAGPAAVTPVVHDDMCKPEPVLNGSTGYNTGDANENGLIDAGEEWKYACTVSADWAFSGPHCNFAYVEDQELLDYLEDNGAAWGFYKGGDVNGSFYTWDGGTKTWNFDKEKLLETNNWDEYCLYPFTLRKEIFLYWDGPEHTKKYYDLTGIVDETVFDVKIKKGEEEIGSIQVSKTSPAYLWLGEGTCTFLEYNLTEGYEAAYPDGISYTTGEGHPDWTLPNVIGYDLYLEKSGPEYVFVTDDSIEYSIKVGNNGPASLNPPVITDEGTNVEFVYEDGYVKGDVNMNNLLDPEEEWYASYTANVSGELEPGTYVYNTACVKDSELPDSPGWFLGGDLYPDNNCDKASVYVWWKGYTPGYWKNHEDAWGCTNYSPNDTLGDVFGLEKEFTMTVKKNEVVVVKPEDTLMDALNYGGGSGEGGAAQVLLRAAAAALLNEDVFGDDYPEFDTVEALKAEVLAALNSGDRQKMLDLADELDYWNNGYHPDWPCEDV